MKADEKVFAAGVSVASNSSLVIAKMIIGTITGSITIISEALHSGIDLLASLIALFSVRAVRKPADREHPFGHGKIENVSGFMEALLILFAAAFIIHESVGKLIHGGEIERLGLGIIVMGASSIVNIFVSIYLFRVAKKTNSLALEADAEHLRTDVYTSIGAMASLIVIHFTGITIIDPIVAILLAIYIGFIAICLTRKTSRDLIDTRLAEEEESIIKKILDGTPELLGYHRLRTRRSGNSRFIDFHVIVPEKIGLSDSHMLSTAVEKSISDALNNSNVTIHMEPCIGNCDDCEQPCPDDMKGEIIRKSTIVSGEENLVRQVRETVAGLDGIVGIDDLHVHRLEAKWEVHIDIVVPPDITVKEGHERSEKLKEELRRERDDLGKISVHVEPEGHVDSGL